MPGLDIEAGHRLVVDQLGAGHSETVEERAAGAWLIVGPPDYAPPITHLVTMYDVMFDMALRSFGARPDIFDVATGQFMPDFLPSYTNDVYPILQRAFDYRWVHSQGEPSRSQRVRFRRARRPACSGRRSGKQSAVPDLQRMRDPSNLNGPSNRSAEAAQRRTGGAEPQSFRFIVTRTQYQMLSRWASGRFKADWEGVPEPPADVTADGLDRASLEGGCGGGFFPGMESGSILRNPALYAEPFRFRALEVEDNETGVTPGDVTKRAAVPWQADFLKCGDNWWPAQRPIRCVHPPRPRHPSNGRVESTGTSIWSSAGPASGWWCQARRPAARRHFTSRSASCPRASAPHACDPTFW